MSAPLVVLRETESFTKTWQIVDLPGGLVGATDIPLPAGMTAKNLTSWSGSILVRDKDAIPGSNMIAGSLTIPTPANGQVKFTFTSVHTTLVESVTGDTDVEGEYTLLLTGPSSEVRYIVGPWRLVRNLVLPAS